MRDSQEFDFDRVIDRRTEPFADSVKWQRYAGRDVLPMWVADMDFAASPAVISALQQRIAHGVFGYAAPTPGLTSAIIEWLRRSYDWAIDPEWLVLLPGLVTGLNVACRAIDGGVLTATPVYQPFMTAPRFAERTLSLVPLNHVGSRWQWDWAALEAAVTPKTQLLLLCHPHNPVGRAWEESELAKLADFCRRHQLIVCSDEIHCDLILNNTRHRPWATLSEDLAARSITLMAPSKSFNIPGLGCSFAVISDATLRRAFTRTMAGIVPHVNLLGYVACEAALRDSEAWHKGLIDILRRNRDLVQTAIASLPPLKMTPVEATYLAWIDVRSLDLLHPQRHFETHGLGLSDGADFGLPGWLRLNFGCPLPTLNESLKRLANGVAAALA